MKNNKLSDWLAVLAALFACYLVFSLGRGGLLSLEESGRVMGGMLSAFVLLLALVGVSGFVGSKTSTGIGLFIFFLLLSLIGCFVY